MTYFVGESGPEMFNPPPGRRIIPATKSPKDSGLSFVEVVVLITAIAVVCILAGVIHAG